MCAQAADLLRSHFQEKLTKQRVPGIGRTSEAFISQNKAHEKITEFQNLLDGRKYKQCGEVQKEIAGGTWREFPGSSRVRDPQAVYPHFASTEGRMPMGFRPPRLDLLLYGSK